MIRGLRTVSRLQTLPTAGDFFVPHYTRIPWLVADPVRIDRIVINEQPRHRKSEGT